MSLPPVRLVQNKGKWYAQVTIPQELRKHFGKRKQLKLSTGTSDFRIAEGLHHEKTEELYAKLREVQQDEATEALSDLETALGQGVDNDNPRSFTKEQWEHLRALVVSAQHPPHQEDEEEAHALEKRGKDVSAAFQRLEELTETSMPISEWAKIYLETKPYGRAKTAKEADTALTEFAAHTEDIPIGRISKVTGYEWAASIGATKSNKTVRKKIGYVSQALTYAEQRGEIEYNPLKGLDLKRYGTSGKSWKPLSDEDVKKLFALNDTPDHVRLLLRILATSGMRLDEAALLEWEDLKTKNDILVYDLTERSDTIKNIGSARFVPVHSSLLEEMNPEDRTGPIFPQFERNSDGKAQGPASKECMAEIRKVTDDPLKVTHSLRGTFKDRLRDAGIPKETNDFITGHGQGDAAGEYGEGPSIEKRKIAIERGELL